EPQMVNIRVVDQIFSRREKLDRPPPRVNSHKRLPYLFPAKRLVIRRINFEVNEPFPVRYTNGFQRLHDGFWLTDRVHRPGPLSAMLGRISRWRVTAVCRPSQ